MAWARMLEGMAVIMDIRNNGRKSTHIKYRIQKNWILSIQEDFVYLHPPKWRL
jgi:hypothetical protein